GVCELGKCGGGVRFVEKRFLRGLLEKGVEVGGDVVLHRGRKLIGGESDVSGGLGVVKDGEVGQKVGFLENGFG
ncbi:PLP-dependent transferase, partial [Bacillus mycoides]|uniref:PLP-dependent transferase n=1 Tax=Bacillus mycoides TaxID=1405 RepID=UPI0016432D93